MYRTQLLGFMSGKNAKNLRHLTQIGILALGDAEVLSFALSDAKVPDARYFAFWWNIGLRPDLHEPSRRHNFQMPKEKQPVAALNSSR